ncbi:thiamine pyrophosphokinase [Gilliamella sp. wkB178]|uniref:thiamine diphosphokinase n=1 Tax=Gilliamella sp. wkB178 TaxID=3120259 RepID=UPI00080E81A9|nr:thiamine diphosphokinase [Gilliamella apicola]OCG07758.1 thiamine pyrophosphokinase [Gilliamella apicola]
MTNKALLFVNGEPPQYYPTNLDSYTYIACTDGAYHNYLAHTSIIPNFIIGDLDSWDKTKAIAEQIQIIHTPDQSKTDFEKALLFLSSKGITEFSVYGASGHASDHFLGNLSVAKHYYRQYKIIFHDNYCHFFYANHHEIINHVKHCIISLLPMPKVTGLTITGFEYPLTDKTLIFGGLTSLRNKAIIDQIEINFKTGDLLVFVEDLHS